MSEDDEVRELLLRLPFFHNLSDTDADELPTLARIEDFPRRTLIFHKGDSGDALYVVLAGRARIFDPTPEGDLELATREPGESFGELSLIDGSPRSASVFVEAGTRLIKVVQDDYLRMVSNSRGMLLDLLSRVSESLRKSNTQLASLTRQKSRVELVAEVERLSAVSLMVAGVAHELNTPLGVIRSAASMIVEALRPEELAKLARDDEARESLQEIVEACALIDKNVQSAHRLMQSFTSLSARNVTDRREAVDLLTVVQETIDAYSPHARRAGLRLEILCALPAAERMWEGYPALLSQILFNFFTNAERYAYPDNAGGKIEIGLSTYGILPRLRGFEISVRDFGRGIEAKHLAQIFTPFFTTGRGRGGTGLGLSIVHGIVTSALGGTIRAQSKPDEGATFLIRIPRTAPERAPSDEQ